MKKSIIILLLLLLSLSLFLISCNKEEESSNSGSTDNPVTTGEETGEDETSGTADMSNTKLISMSNEFADAMIRQDFINAGKDFDPFMAQEFTPEVLSNMWQQFVLINAGAFKKKNGERIVEIDNYSEVYVNCEFQKCCVDVKVTIDRDENKIVGVSFGPSPSLEDINEFISTSHIFMDLLSSNNFSSAIGYFNDNMKKQVTEDGLKKTWNDIVTPSHGGPFREIIRETISRETDKNTGIMYNSLYLSCEFENTGMEINMVFDDDKKIAGLFFNQKPSFRLMDKFKGIAFKVVDELAAEKFPEARESFSENLKQALPEEELKAGWENIISQVGPYQKRYGATADFKDGYNVLFVVCRFEKALIEIQMTFDQEDKIAGLFFNPKEEQ